MYIFTYLNILCAYMYVLRLKSIKAAPHNPKVVGSNPASATKNNSHALAWLLFLYPKKYPFAISMRVMSPRANNLPEMRALAVRDEASIFGRSGLKNRAGEQREDFLANRKSKGRRFGYCLSNQRKRNIERCSFFSYKYIRSMQKAPFLLQFCYIHI